MYSKLMIINRIGQFTMVIHKLRRIAIGFSILAVLTGCKPPSKISEIRFADNAFENCILGLGVEEFAEVTRIDCSSLDIESADEIKYFTDLEYLNLSLNHLTELDVSNNVKLQRLEFWGQVGEDGFSSITFGTLPELTSLFVIGEYLEKTDITANTFETQLPKLEEFISLGTPTKNDITLSLQHSKLRSISILDTTRNKALPANLALTLELPALTEMVIDGPGLKSLSLDNTPQLEELTIINTPLSSLTLADMPKLTEAHLDDNKLSDLTLKNLPILHFLNAQDNQLTSLDSSDVPALDKLYLANNKLKSMRYANPNVITILGLQNNQLSSFDAKIFPNLDQYSVDNNPLAKVEEKFAKGTGIYTCITRGGELPYFSHISRIYCDRSFGYVVENGDFTQFNSLLSLTLKARINDGILDMSTLDGLERVNLRVTNLNQIKWPTDSSLEDVNLEDSDIRNLTIPTLPKLTNLFVENLEQLDVFTIEPQPSLELLRIYEVNTPKITVKQAKKMTKLILSRSPLDELYLEDMPALEKLQIYHGSVKSLVLKNVPNLKELCMYHLPSNIRVTSDTSTVEEIQKLVTGKCSD